MKKNILKLFYIPLIFLTFFSFIYFIVIYFVIKKEVNEEVKNYQKIVIKQKKEELKRDIKNFEYLFSLIRNSIYTTSLEEMKTLLNYYLQGKQTHNNELIIWDVTNKKLNYSIENNRYIILKYKNKKYLVFLKNIGKKVYLIGIKKDLIDNIVLNEIRKYLNKINKNQASYIAMGKINTFHPSENGIFGYIYYMPPKFKRLEGKLLSINKTDIKGNYYRKHYLECLAKKPEGCFIEYYFKNPKTLKIEKKLSYISFMKDYNLDILKGVYKSQIKNSIKLQGNFYKKKLFKLFLFSLLVFLIMYIIFIYLLYMGLKKIRDSVLDEYNELKIQLEGKYFYDNLTSLPNRIKLQEDLKNRDISQIAIIDIKDFGIINELYGFKFGDKILIKFAEELKDRFDMVYKYGNDEFILATKDVFDNLITNINAVLESIVKEFKIKLEINMGISNIRPLLENAEMALYEAKRKDKFFVVYNDELKDKEKEKYQKIQKLKKVLKSKDIIPYYQCIVNKNYEVIKYEALMRIKIEDKIYSPYFFMDLIKEAKLYESFSKIMIEKVFDDLKFFDKKVSINLSYKDIISLDMINFILKKLEEVDASKVVFEILESEGIENYTKVEKFLKNVKEKGVFIAIDDFGSGYSNFAKIVKLNPDYLKIDASLIKDITNKKNYKLVKLMSDFAKEFNISTVAEFVANKEILEKLEEIGVDEYQGFYFCEPKPFENIIKKDKISSKKGENED